MGRKGSIGNQSFCQKYKTDSSKIITVHRFHFAVSQASH